MLPTEDSKSAGGDPYQLNAEKVNAAEKSVGDVNAAEAVAIIAAGKSLEALVVENKEDAARVREDLRHELHGYSALHLPIPIEDLHASFKANLREERFSLEDTFRSGGLLKGHVHAITEALGLGFRHLMYRGNLEAVQAHAMLLGRAAEIPELLEAQGKSDMLEGLQDMSEKMRTAGQSRLLKLIPKFVKGSLRLARTAGLAENVVNELIESAKLLDPDVAERILGAHQVAGAGGAPSVAATSVRPTTAGSSRPGSRGRSAAGTSKAKSFVALIAHDRLARIREGQRRISAILFVQQLPASVICVLASVEEALSDLAEANALIDECVGDECSLPLRARRDEQALMIARTGRMMRMQLDSLVEGSARFFKMFLALAKVVENHHAKAQIVDVNVAHVLNEMHGAFSPSLVSTFMQNASDLRVSPPTPIFTCPHT